MSQHVFALDIGTQSVTGILLDHHDGAFSLKDLYTVEHHERAMLDGQIQDVVQVAEIIEQVKKTLEAKHGPLRQVCVAAAGRALKTIQTSVSHKIEERPIRTEEELKHIELSAVQQAQFQLAEEKSNQFHDYYCVGYSVLHYKLDGDIIGSVIDQTGEHISIEVIATFLPKVVVESLMAALERAGLQMAALTLEPIAAIHVLIPKTMRRLNVALIDIGAGTSDIAIANDGTIIAYGMVPVAGDEITERISDHFLLDFKEAEKLKRHVVDEKIAQVQDILGFDVEVTYDELCSIIEPSVDRLAELLAHKVCQLNKQAPQAIMLIGGGSLTPMIEAKLAHHLGLPHNRVAVRGSEAIQMIEDKSLLPKGPDFVTPVGIAISATENPFLYKHVTVNGKNTLLITMEHVTIADCLIQAGIDMNQYYGKIGLAYFITVNGEAMTLPGSYGTAPIIKLNGREVTVNESVHEQDKIEIYKGEDGRSPSVTIKEIVGSIEPITCYVNNEKYTVQATYLANGQIVDQDYRIQDKDAIEVQLPRTVKQFLAEIEEPIEIKSTMPVYVNGQLIHLSLADTKLRMNGAACSPDSQIENQARIELLADHQVTVSHLLEKLDMELEESITVTFNDERVQLTKKKRMIQRKDQTLTADDPLQAYDDLTITERTKQPFIFQDVFRYIDMEKFRLHHSYTLLCNGKEVSFQHEIQHGDRLQLILE